MNGPWDRRRSAPRVRYSFLLICLYSGSRGNVQPRKRAFFWLIGWLVAKEEPSVHKDSGSLAGL